MENKKLKMSKGPVNAVVVVFFTNDMKSNNAVDRAVDQAMSDGALVYTVDDRPLLPSEQSWLKESGLLIP